MKVQWTPTAGDDDPKHVNFEKVTWENNRKNEALKSGVDNASKKRNA